MLLTQDKDITELEVGDELYRLKLGKTIYYRKIKIVHITERKSTNKYVYIVKGSTGKKKHVVTRLNIVAYKSRFFKDYSSMMVHLISMSEIEKQTFSKTLLQDIEYFKKSYSEYLI